MTLDDFRLSLDQSAPPAGAAPALAALWWQGKGNWEEAHRHAQAANGPDGDWVHAHLHRVEGDLGNAAYWYRRAGRPPASGDLRAEWREIAAALLRQGGGAGSGGS